MEITTLDNPGWLVSIDVAGTTEDRPFPETKIERSELDWIHCRREGTKFCGYGGVLNFEELLGVFLDWAAEVPP